MFALTHANTAYLRILLCIHTQMSDEMSAFYLFSFCLSKSTDLYSFVQVLTRGSSADREAAVARVAAAGLRCVRGTQAASQSLCGLGVWSAADGQGGEGQIHPPSVCVRVCVLVLAKYVPKCTCYQKSEGREDILAGFHNFKDSFEG